MDVHDVHTYIEFLMMFAHIMGGRGLLFFSGSDKEGTLAARVLKRPSNGGGKGEG